MTTRAEINERLKKVNIKGKLYVEVTQMVEGFLALFPNGRITTEFLVVDPEWAVCQATIWDGDVAIATGTAKEFRAASNINKSSFVENCETSAVGRALSFAGIGSIDGIASADEMAHAMAQQNSNQTKFAPKIVEVDKNDRTYWRGLYIKACKLYPGEEVKATVDSIIDTAGSKSDNWTDEQCQLVAQALQMMIENKEDENGN